MPPKANVKFIEWLEEAKVVAEQNNNRNLTFSLAKAAASLKKEMLPLSPFQLTTISGIGPAIQQRIVAKCRQFLITDGHSIAQLYAPGVQIPVFDIQMDSATGSTTTTTAPKKGKKRDKEPAGEDETIIDMLEDQFSQAVTHSPAAIKQKKPYAPKYRSGGFGLMVALYKHKNQQMNKAELCELAQQWSDASYTAQAGPNGGPVQLTANANGQAGATSKFSYNAWSSMATLIKQEMVIKQGNPARYSLTHVGVLAAAQLVKRIETFLDPVPRLSSSTACATTQPVKDEIHVKKNKNNGPRASIIQFQYWYLNAQQRRVKLRSEAVESNDGWFKIEYHKSQSHHPFINQIRKLNIIPDAAGMLMGMLNRTVAMHECPGIGRTSDIEEPIDADSILKTDQPQVPTVNDQFEFTVPQAMQRPAKKQAVSQPSALTPRYTTNEHQPTGNSTQILKAAVKPSPAMMYRGLITPTNERLASSNSREPFSLWPAVAKSEPLSIAWTGPPIRLAPNSFDIYMLIDNREVKSKNDRDFFLNALSERVSNVQCRQLDLGDVMWIARPRISNGGVFQEIVLDALLERKRLDDLVQSIKDGRFKEQKSRLRKSALRRIWYLVEEYGCHVVEDFGAAPLRTAIVETCLIDGIYAKRTSSIEATVDFLSLMHKVVTKLYAGKELYALPSGLVTSDNHAQFKRQCESRDRRDYHYTYHEFGELVSKSRTSTLRDMWFKQLMCVRGLSLEKTGALVTQFPTMRHLVDALGQYSTTEQQVASLRQLNAFVPRKALNDASCRKIVELFAP